MAQMHDPVNELIMTQYHINKGIKVFGKDGITVVKKEMMQLHNRKVRVPVNLDELTSKQKWAVLKYLMFLKRKRCMRIKGRGCADGRLQQAYIG
eukprot:5283632-Ditylum_brightwellii.AAC.2